MVRWIAFDDDTADALVGKFKRGAAEIRDGNVLDSALRHDDSSILIYPSTSPERVLLARVTSGTAKTSSVEPAVPLPMQSFRPLSVPQVTKRPWWRRHTA